MYSKAIELHKMLVDVAKSISHSITNKENTRRFLDEVENWLKARFERIRIQKLKDSKAIRIKLDTYEQNIDS